MSGERAILRRDAASGKAGWLVLFLHGLGSNGADLMTFADYWQGAMPDVAFVAPDAPSPCPDGGYQWMQRLPVGHPRMYDEADAARGGIDTLIDEELARLGLDGTRLALVGFSQGTVMALHVGLRRRETPVAILGYAGGLVGADRLSDEMKSKPPVMLIHGEQDEVVPVYAMMESVKALTNAGIVAAGQTMPGLGHAVNEQALVIGARFILSAISYREKHPL